MSSIWTVQDKEKENAMEIGQMIIFLTKAWVRLAGKRVAVNVWNSDSQVEEEMKETAGLSSQY